MLASTRRTGARALVAATLLAAAFGGWHAAIITSEPELGRSIGLRPQRRYQLYNGALECRLFEYKLMAGTMRRNKPDAPRQQHPSPRPAGRG